MSIITKIRNRSGLAIGFVGVALVLFVVSDALNSNFGLFGGSPQSNNVGEINGEKISIKQFEERFERNIAKFKERTQQDNIDENTRGQIREQVWTEFINDFLMNRIYTELGITVSNDELLDMLYGNNIHPQIRQAFTDPNTQQFDANNVKRYLKQVSETSDEKIKAQWKDFEDYLVTETLQKKFTNLIRRGVYATSLEAKNVFKNRSNSKELNIIAMPFFSIADTAIAEDESELKSYFKKNKYRYTERENTRKVDFVVWDFAPTSEDTAAIQKWAFEQFEQFKTATNDTLFVNANSDKPFDVNAKPRNQFPEEIVDRLFNSPVGTVLEPIFKDGKFQVYKVSGIKEDTIFYMRASHILFRVEGSTKEDTINANKKANEVLARIRKGEKFEDMAREFGTDGTKERGGDLGWFGEGQMVKEFNDAVLRGKKGDIFIVKTQFGIHIVKVTEDKSKKLVCAGVIERAVEASDKTTAAAYNEASQFAAAYRNEKDFEAAVAEKGYIKRTADMLREKDNFLPGYNDARAAVMWAFNAKLGEVSDVITIGNDKYVVAIVKNIREKGKAEFNNVRERVLNDYRKEQKGIKLSEQMAEAMKSVKNLDELSVKLNQPINPVGNQTFDNASIPVSGYDPIVAGIISGTVETNKLIGPVTGDAGVYAFVINKINEQPIPTELNQYRNEVANNLQSKLEYGYNEALLDIKKVKDQRFKFY
ncbi:MAG: SurA N-terminal domain-containing protein [Bacteroidia bacterium]